MRTGLSAIQGQILAADVKKCWWLVEIDHNNDGIIDEYISTQAKTWDGHDYLGYLKSTSSMLLPMPDMPAMVIPPVKTTLKIAGMHGIELTPDNTAVSDGIGQTEADATTGWTGHNSPDTFESTAAGTPNVGTYHFHIVDSDDAGFSKTGFTFVAGTNYTVTFDCKKVSGSNIFVDLYDGDGSHINIHNYDNTDYESKVIKFTSAASGSSGRIVLRTSSGPCEFYVDNISLKRDVPYASNHEAGTVIVRLVGGGHNVEFTPSGTAISDSQTEADVTGDWIEYGTPDTFDSIDTDPNSGTYHFHVDYSSSGQHGFYLPNLNFIAGAQYSLTFYYKKVGGYRVQVLVIDGDGTTEISNTEYSETSWTLVTVNFTPTIGGSSGKIVFCTRNSLGGTEFYIDTVSLIGYAEAELMAWKFKVNTASSVDQVLTLNCQDFFTHYLEGDYPNTPLVSDLFPADIMKADNICVPLAFGTPFFPIRWTVNSLTVSFTDSDTFTTAGDKTGQFQADQFLWADCGVDGIKKCWVTSSSFAAAVTTVELTAGSDDLTANLATVMTDQYILGPNSPTYTIDKARTPREVNFKSTYDSGDYTFIQGNVTGSDAVIYKCVQLLIDVDDTNDANGHWAIKGKEIYDLPVRFSRDDTVALTSPEEIAEYIMEDWGIPSADIDATSQAAVAAIFAGRSFTLDVGLWYQVTRTKLISKLFAVAGMVPVYRDSVGFKVLTKVSQYTLTENEVIPGSFRISPIYTKKQKDSGYVTWQTSTEPVDQVNKSLIAAKSTTANPSNTVIEAEWCLDSIKAQKAGILALQRVLLKDKKINFTAHSKILVLEPGDMITINALNFGAENTYDCMITQMTIREGLLVDVECMRFSDDLDDWGDLSADAITAVEAITTNAYSPVFQGPSDLENSAGGRANEITKSVIITGGADLTLDGSDTDPGIIKFKGSNYSAEIGGDADGNRFAIIPLTDDVVTLYVGQDDSWWGPSTVRFKAIDIHSSQLSKLVSGAFSGAVNGGTVSVNGNVSESEPVITLTLYDKTAEASRYYHFLYDSVYPGTTNVQDLGTSGNKFKTLYITNIITASDTVPIVLAANAGAAAPTHSAVRGTLYVTSAGILYINVDSSTTWQKVGGQ